MKRAWLLCLGLLLASCSRGKELQPPPGQPSVSPPLTIQWSALEVIAPVPAGFDAPWPRGSRRVPKISAAQGERPQVVWLDWSFQPHGHAASPVVWSEREGAGWSEPRPLSTKPPEHLRHLLIVADAAGESVVAWTEGVLTDSVMCRRHQGEWSAPRPLGVQGSFPSGHLLKQPGNFGFFYTEYVAGFLPDGGGSWRLLFRPLEGGQAGAPAVIAGKGRYESEMAVGSAPNGDTVLVFFVRKEGLLGREGPLELCVTALPAGEGEWTQPVSLVAYPRAKGTPEWQIEMLWAVDVWAESGAQLSVVYDLSLDDESHLYVATWTKGGQAAVHRLEGWPVRPTPRDERNLRVLGLPDGSLILLYASGSYLEAAHCRDGQVLTTSQEHFPGGILDMDLDAEGRLHVVGTSVDALWYRLGTPGWIGQ